MSAVHVRAQSHSHTVTQSHARTTAHARVWVPFPPKSLRTQIELWRVVQGCTVALSPCGTHRIRSSNVSNTAAKPAWAAARQCARSVSLALSRVSCENRERDNKVVSEQCRLAEGQCLRSKTACFRGPGVRVPRYILVRHSLRPCTHSSPSLQKCLLGKGENKRAPSALFVRDD